MQSCVSCKIELYHSRNIIGINFFFKVAKVAEPDGITFGYTLLKVRLLGGIRPGGLDKI